MYMVPWYFPVIALFCGAFVGIMVAALCAASGRDD